MAVSLITEKLEEEIPHLVLIHVHQFKFLIDFKQQ